MSQSKTLSLSEAISLIPEFADSRDATSAQRRLQINDIYVQVSASLELLEHRLTLPTGVFESMMRLASHSGCLRTKLVDAAFRVGRPEWADHLLEKADGVTPTINDQNLQLANAIHNNNWKKYVSACCGLFLETAKSDYLFDAADAAREHIGWQQAWPLYLRLFFIAPKPHTNLVMTVLQMFQRDGLEEQFRTFGECTKELEGCNIPTGFWMAQCALYNKEYDRCIRFLENSGSLKIKQKIGSAFYSLYAQALEQSGRYEEAASAYFEQNRIEATDEYTYDGFVEELEKRNRLHRGKTAGEEATDIAIFTGFPRSGTTLLENALDAHPSIATAEETGAFARTYFPAYREVLGAGSPREDELQAAAKEHRSRYYREIRRLSSKANAMVNVDKTPILSANIQYASCAFPNMRYLFAVRHPYDVVLSNFKQRYEQNSAMAAFNQMDTACDLYDYVMSSWFDVFPRETDRVCYVYYHELVTDFEATARRVIDFLGVEWDAAVLDFAEYSKKRAVRTPSYANVRKGLSLGVQSSYQNYLFLFDDYCRSKLDPWVEFFGYTVEGPKT